MLNVIVKGGTGAGRRRLRERPKDWTCPVCETELRYYWKRCPNDGTARPTEE